MSFIDKIKERAKQNKKRIVLPETMDERVLKAASIALKEDLAHIILIGNKEDIIKKEEGLSKAEFIDPNTFEKTNELVESLTELRKHKGMTLDKAKELLLNDYMYFACMLVYENLADGVVSGACHSTANTLRPALQILKTKEESLLVSAFFFMVVPNCEYGENGAFIFADAGLEQNPTPEKLAAIALDSADSFKLLTQKNQK